MRTRFFLALIVSVALLSCKDDKKSLVEGVDGTETSALKSNNKLTLSNCTDENWKKGVGVVYKNMFLVDFSQENEALIKNGKEIVLQDGTSIPIIGFEVVGNYIHILFAKSIMEYSAAAEFPNELTIK